MIDRATLIADLQHRASGKPRLMVGVAGAPGSGKSTLAADLVTDLKAAGETAVVVPMDGYHFDDIVLNARGHRQRKGAPHTFDAAGFEVLLKRIRAREPEIAIPVFDRSLELSRAAADIVEAETRFIVVEGNYLLLDQKPWSNLKPLFDVTIFLQVPLEVIKQRLLDRIKHYGHDEAFAQNWMLTNDIPNAITVIDQSATADVLVRNG
jgi:pantothenate kinase